MKYKFFFILTSLFFITLFASECKKHKPSNPVDQLPPETQIGANTFGCLINGEAFLPKGPSLSPILQCAYQYLNTNYSQGYFFQLSAGNKRNSSNVFGIGIFSDSLAIKEGVFTLNENQKRNAYGLYSRFQEQGNIVESTILYTKSNLSGQLIITKFDEINQIVAGTFWFNVVKSPGDTIKVTDGRFDMQFTK
ncbi:MAG: hypothetical protein ABI267_08820 [Ginsengibacter sp.]